MTRTINAAGLALIREFEGCRLEAYQDQAGVWTIGYGHTGRDVTPGLTITQEQAERLLVEGIAETEGRVLVALKRAPTDNQFAAMVSLAFNIGAGAFSRSTVLRLFNAGDIAGAANAFSMWRKVTVNGKKVDSAGLIRRRAAEAALFLTPDEPTEAEPLATVSAQPADSLIKSRTIGGAALVPVSIALNEIAAAIEPLAPYMDSLKYVFIGLSVLGAGIAAYARWDDLRGAKR